MSASAKFTAQRLLSIRPWAPNLFSFTIARDAALDFVPGQFARLGVTAPARAGANGAKVVWRAYSIASPRRAEYLEFFSVVLPDGEFTSELARLRVGDEILVERVIYGFLTLDRLAPGRDLWLLCTGTGLAPFLSMLREAATWNDYGNLVLVHCVRYANELAYADEIHALAEGAKARGARAALHYVPVVTRTRVPGALTERVPALLEGGALAARVGLPIDSSMARVLICGNPDMISQTRKLLSARGFATSRRGKPGQMAVENYW